ncbi:LapA family protein [Sciscionella sediminilitoris]|uniref:LapA family protein n=1 Tax=Sciscionella sediminilitoris TaxID=1445613 RepID=UPI001E584BDA|nr:lipopolysaccharide assembly protein LapA domain-containing protein [Sciscionella sp. SE31]
MNNKEQQSSEQAEIPEAVEAPGTTEVEQAAETPAPSTSTPAKPKVKNTRMGVVWTTLVLAAIVLVLLLIFIVQNLQPVKIYFFGAQGELPAGVALLLAAVGGVLLVAIPGYGRILQLRKAAKKAGSPK